MFLQKCTLGPRSTARGTIFSRVLRKKWLVSHQRQEDRKQVKVLISQKASKLSDQVKVTPEPIEMTVSCRVPWLIKHDYKEVWENCPETQDGPGTGLGV